jgi:hypothetical protein
MADETEQLLKEMKDILSLFKEISTHTKDMTAAMADMARPAQQSSEYLKVVSDQVDAAQKASALMFEDQKKMIEVLKSSVELLKERNKHTEDEKSLHVQILAARAKRVEIEAAKSQMELDSLQRNVAERDQAQFTNNIWAEQVGYIEKASNLANTLQEKIAKAGYEMVKLKDGTQEMQAKAGPMAAAARAVSSGIRTTGFAATGHASMGDALKGMASSISSTFMSTMGIGGIIGMIIHGVHRQEGFRAAGEVAAQQFDAIGGHTKKLSSELGVMARTMETFGFGTKEGLAAVTAAFASTGVTAEEAMRKIEGTSSVLSKGPMSLLEATIAADKSLELADGTIARMAGTLQSQFNEQAGSAAMRLLDIGTAAGKAGLNVATFMAQTMDAASSVRMLNINFEDFGKMQLQMTKAMTDKKFGATFSGEYAAAGAAGVGSAVSGMSDGMAAILGEKMGLGTGLDAIYKLQSPLARESEDKLSMESIIKAMRDVLSSVGNTKAEKFQFLTKGPMGLSPEAADLVMNATDELDSTKGLSAVTKNGLKRGLESEPAKKNRMDQNIEIIKDAVANIMVGLLGLVINGLKLIYNSVLWLGAKLSTIIPGGGGDTPEMRDLLSSAGSNMGLNIKELGAGLTGIKNSLIQAKKAGGGILDVMGLSTAGMTSPGAVVSAIMPKPTSEPTAQDVLLDLTIGKLGGRAIRALADHYVNQTPRKLIITEEPPMSSAEKTFTPGK